MVCFLLVGDIERDVDPSRVAQAPVSEIHTRDNKKTVPQSIALIETVRVLST